MSLPFQGPDKSYEHGLLFRHVLFDPLSGCWLWTASRTPGGYGQTRRWSSGGPSVAHRRMYNLLIGPVPEDMDLDHLCRVRHCVNPAHLEVVTRQENLLRGKLWKRAQAGAGRLLCGRGHQKEVFPDGAVRCRECRNARRRMAPVQ